MMKEMLVKIAKRIFVKRFEKAVEKVADGNAENLDDVLDEFVGNLGMIEKKMVLMFVNELKAKLEQQ